MSSRQGYVLKNRTMTSDGETRLYVNILNISIGAVCAGQREPKPHGRADVRTQRNQRSRRRVHASGEYHCREEDPEVRFKEHLHFLPRIARALTLFSRPREMYPSYKFPIFCPDAIGVQN